LKLLISVMFVVFSQTLQFHCNVIICRMYVVCLYHACIVTKRLKIGSFSFHQNVAQCHSSLPATVGDGVR